MPNMSDWALGRPAILPALPLPLLSGTVQLFFPCLISFLFFKMKAAIPLPSVKHFQCGSISGDFWDDAV